MRGQIGAWPWPVRQRAGLDAVARARVRLVGESRAVHVAGPGSARRAYNGLAGPAEDAGVGGLVAGRGADRARAGTASTDTAVSRVAGDQFQLRPRQLPERPHAALSCSCRGARRGVPAILRVLPKPGSVMAARQSAGSGSGYARG